MQERFFFFFLCSAADADADARHLPSRVNAQDGLVDFGAETV